MPLWLFFSLPPFFYLFIYFKTFFGYEKQRSVEMEASEQGWWYTNDLPFFWLIAYTLFAN